MTVVTPHRPVRSFKPRRGRITPRQARALERWADAYVLPVSTRHLDPERVFGRRAPLVLEVGFGMGEATAALAADQPDRDVLAVDVHTPGAGALLHEIAERELSNVRLLLGDAVDVLRDMVAPGTLTEVRVFFPDPWPKARHAKRRLVQGPFLALVAERLAPGGRLHVATDDPAYAAGMLAAVDAEPRLRNPCGGPAPRPPWRPVTRFERQALAAGRAVVDVVAQREDG